MRDKEPYYHAISALGGVKDLPIGTEPNDAVNVDQLEQAIANIESVTSLYYNIKNYGAIGDGITDDTGAFNNALADIPMTGGTLFIPAGKYLVSSQIIIDKTITILGEGMAGGYNPFIIDGVLRYEDEGITRIYSTVQNQSTLKILSYPTIIDGIDFNYIGSTPIENNTAILYLAGAGAKLKNISVANFYDGIRVERYTSEYDFSNVMFSGWYRYGLYLNNNLISDYADMTLTNSIFKAALRPNQAAIHFAGGGGVKIVATKINTSAASIDNNGFSVNGIEIKNVTGSTSDIQVIGGSIENFTGSGIKGIADDYVTANIQVTGVQFLQYYKGTAHSIIDLNNITSAGTITGCAFSTENIGSEYAIKLGANVSNYKIIGNVYNNISPQNYLLDVNNGATSNQISDLMSFDQNGDIAIYRKNATSTGRMYFNGSRNAYLEYDGSRFFATQEMASPIITGTNGFFNDLLSQDISSGLPPIRAFGKPGSQVFGFGVGMLGNLAYLTTEAGSNESVFFQNSSGSNIAKFDRNGGFRSYGSTYVDGAGSYLTWNDGLSGTTHIINQQGGGTDGGVVIQTSTPLNVRTTLARFRPNGNLDVYGSATATSNDGQPTTLTRNSDVILNQSSSVQSASYKISGIAQANSFVSTNSFFGNLSNVNSGNNISLLMSDNGAVFLRGIADSNPTLNVINTIGTGKIQTWQQGVSSVTVASIGNNGIPTSDTDLIRLQDAQISNVVSSAPSLTLSNGGYYTFNGTTSTWTLPPLVGNTKKRFLIMNQGSGSVTISSNTGGNDIYNGMNVNSITINAGEVAQLYNNSLSWFKQL